jgi:hypothetical protein
MDSKETIENLDDLDDVKEPEEIENLDDDSSDDSSTEAASVIENLDESSIDSIVETNDESLEQPEVVSAIDNSFDNEIKSTPEIQETINISTEIPTKVIEAKKVSIPCFYR